MFCAVNIKIVSANALTEAILSASTFFIPSKKGCAFIIKLDKCVPIVSNPSKVLSIKPLTILPANSPIISPT